MYGPGVDEGSAGKGMKGEEIGQIKRDQCGTDGGGRQQKTDWKSQLRLRSMTRYTDYEGREYCC